MLLNVKAQAMQAVDIEVTQAKGPRQIHLFGVPVDLDPRVAEPEPRPLHEEEGAVQGQAQETEGGRRCCCFGAPAQGARGRKDQQGKEDGLYQADKQKSFLRGRARAGDGNRRGG